MQRCWHHSSCHNNHSVRYKSFSAPFPRSPTPPHPRCLGTAPGTVTLIHTLLHKYTHTPYMHVYPAAFPFQISCLRLTSEARLGRTPPEWLYLHNLHTVNICSRLQDLTALCQQAVLVCEVRSATGVSHCCRILCSTATGRRSAPPLNLTGLPGTEKLNEREKEVRAFAALAHRGRRLCVL